MRTTLLVVILAFGAAGCGRARPAHDPNATFQGFPAYHWGEVANDADWQTAIQGVNALRALRADGVPYLVDAAKRAGGQRRGVLVGALSGIGRSVDRCYIRELDGDLRDMMTNSKEWTESASAVSLLLHFPDDAKDFVVELRGVYTREKTDPYTRKRAGELLRQIDPEFKPNPPGKFPLPEEDIPPKPPEKKPAAKEKGKEKAKG